MIDLVREHAAIEKELRAAIDRVLASGRFVLGPEVEVFELALAEKLGVKHAIGCASGSDALAIALRAVGVSVGDEVLTTAFSFVATAEAISRVGATPVFLDIDSKTYDLGEDLERIFAQVTAKTRAIIPVHLFGQAMPMRALVERAHRLGIAVIEDAAQSIGAKDADNVFAGTSGDFGVLSFFPTKNLGALGDGGMILTNDHAYAIRALALRVHGRIGDRSELVGMNSRLDALQAAVLAVKLEYLDQFTERRQENARLYNLAFGSGSPFVRAGGTHVYNQYTVRVRDREKLREVLGAEDIASAIYYARPLHREPCFAYAGGPLVEAERAAEEVLSLPIAPSISSEEIERIASLVSSFLI